MTDGGSEATLLCMQIAAIARFNEGLDGGSQKSLDGSNLIFLSLAQGPKGRVEN